VHCSNNSIDVCDAQIVSDAHAVSHYLQWTEYDIADPRWDTPLLGGGEAPWCNCPSKWCEDVDYMNPQAHTPISCSAASTSADLQRFRRSESSALFHNASIGFWKGYAYQTDPVKSYQDMALFYTKKMMESFADGVYYDDAFLHASFVPSPAGPAYVDDNGTLHAGVGLWAWRNFLRRSATMQRLLNDRARMPTVLYIHMTNVNVIPWLSWASINLDWEWRDQNGLEQEDVQTRNRIGCDDRGKHCNDTSFILAQTAGLQSGNIPIAISSGLRGPNCTSRPDLFGKAGGPARFSACVAWLMKTQFATCVPHEVRPEGLSYGLDLIPASPDGEFEATPSVNNVSTVLSAWGYGDSRCDVFRFWEPGFPIFVSGANVLPLVVHCSERGTVMVFFGSFGPVSTVCALYLCAHTRMPA
jgi:hypothetical protein